MKRTLAITATTAMLALSLAGCGAERNGDVDLLPDFDGTNGEFGTTATDTMRNDNGMTGTGTAGGATANTNTANSGLGSVTGAVGGAYGSARYGTTSRDYAGRSGYAATTPEKDAAASADRYALMLENGRVHDTDGFLLDGENASWRTF